MAHGSSIPLAFVVGLLCAPAGGQEPSSVMTTEMRPVRKVVTLLQEMKSQVEKEGDAEDEAHNKYMCWCATGKQEKTADVEVSEQRITDLEALVEEMTAQEGRLKTEIEDLSSGIATDQDSLAGATALRDQEATDFSAASADSQECIRALTEALAILAKVQLLQRGGGTVKGDTRSRPLLLQLSSLLRGVRAKLNPAFQSVMRQDLWDVFSSLDVPTDGRGSVFLPTKPTVLPALLARQHKDRTLPRADGRALLPWEKTEETIGKEERPDEGVRGAVAGVRSYNARSGEIYGVLAEMKAEFERKLAAAQKNEISAAIAFQHLRASKLGELAAATAQKDQKEARLAEAQKKAAEAKEDIEATKGALSADQQLLVRLGENCKVAEEEHVARAKARGEELRALAEVLGILTEDAARDLYAKTTNFLQTDHQRNTMTDSSEAATLTQSVVVNQAMRHILHMARRHKNWVLASLAVRVRLDSFTEVKAVMEKMLTDLKAQQKAESEKLEYCSKEVDETEDTMKTKSNEKEDLERRRLSLKNAIAKIHADVDTLKSEIADMQVSLKKAGESRKFENSLFQQSMADQSATTNILKKAFVRLKEFYAAKDATLTQIASRGRSGGEEPSVALTPPPPRPVAAYNKNVGAGGVLQLIDTIINAAERAEAELLVSEQHAQANYGVFVSDATVAIEANRAVVVEKTDLLQQSQSSLSETEGSLLVNNDDLTKLGRVLHGLHLDCDYLIKYYHVRQHARAEEVGAITEAKAILSGARLSTALEEADEAAIAGGAAA